MKSFIERSIYRFTVYVFIGICLFYILKFVTDFFSLPHVDVVNTRYLLSAMAQAQAAIIAIVITISLVAVQLAASNYSPRVIRIFKHNFDLWFLLTLYGVSILYDLYILKLLSGQISESLIFVSYWLCALAFFALFPYVLGMMNILNPQAIIKRLLEDVSLPRLELGTQKEWLREDTFQPIIDIIRNAFMKNDYETVVIGIRGMKVQTTRIMESHDIEKYRFMPGKATTYDPFQDFSKYYCRHMDQIGRLFLERDDELVLEVIEGVEGIADVMTRKGVDAEEYVVEALGSIGKISVQKEFQEATNRTLDIIGNIGKNIAYEDYAETLPDGNEYAYHYRKVMQRVVRVFRNMSVPAVEKWGVYELQTVGRNFREVGTSIAKKGRGNEWEFIDLMAIFGDVGLAALSVEKNASEIKEFILCDRVVEPLRVLGKIAHEKGMTAKPNERLSGFGSASFSLWEVGMYSAIRGFDTTAKKSAKALAEFAILEKSTVEDVLNLLKGRKLAITSSRESQDFVDTYRGYLRELAARKGSKRKQCQIEPRKSKGQ